MASIPARGADRRSPRHMPVRRSAAPLASTSPEVDMSDRFVVQVRRRTVGIAVRHGGGFNFFASEPGFFALEGKAYPSLRAVILAAEAQAEACCEDRLQAC